MMFFGLRAHARQLVNLSLACDGGLPRLVTQLQPVHRRRRDQPRQCLRLSGLSRVSRRSRQRLHYGSGSPELAAEGAPVWTLNQEIGRSGHTIRRAVIILHLRPERKPVRLPAAIAGRAGRRSPAARPLVFREIARGLAGPQAPSHWLADPLAG
jgi:hypothetical protein